MNNIYIGDTLIDPTAGPVTVLDVNGDCVVELKDKSGRIYTRSVHYIQSWRKVNRHDDLRLSKKSIFIGVAAAVVFAVVIAALY
jgi:hypothetical protein